MVTPISIRTLGDLAAHGYGLNALCEKCRHRADLDLMARIARFGPDFRYISPGVDPYLVCGSCGSRKVETQIHNCLSDRSRFADGR
jgi:hypothetical protein